MIYSKTLTDSISKDKAEADFKTYLAKCLEAALIIIRTIVLKDRDLSPA